MKCRPNFDCAILLGNIIHSSTHKLVNLTFLDTICQHELKDIWLIGLRNMKTLSAVYGVAPDFAKLWHKIKV